MKTGLLVTVLLSASLRPLSAQATLQVQPPGRILVSPDSTAPAPGYALVEVRGVGARLPHGSVLHDGERAEIATPAALDLEPGTVVIVRPARGAAAITLTLFSDSGGLRKSSGPHAGSDVYARARRRYRLSVPSV
jgi:hypothetical protein